MKRRDLLKKGLASFSLFASECAFGNSSLLKGFSEVPEDKFTCEALFYRATPRGIKCNLCPLSCNVSDIRPGSCRTKIVSNNKLISVAYGNPYYVKIENPEKEHLYHFRPQEKILALGTAGCNLSCQYCNVAAVSQKRPDEVTATALFPEDVIAYCRTKGIKAIAYTYSEPVAFYEYMLATAKLAHASGIKNIMVSNGFINEAPLREIGKYLDAAVISIKAFSDLSYQKISGGSVFSVFNTLKILKELNIWLEITHVIVPGWTDNFELLEKMCDWLTANHFGETPFHFQRFEPAYRFSQLKPTPDETLKKAVQISVSKGLKFVYQQSLRNFTVCPQCHKTIISRTLGKSELTGLTQGFCSCGLKIPGIW